MENICCDPFNDQQWSIDARRRGRNGAWCLEYEARTTEHKVRKKKRQEISVFHAFSFFYSFLVVLAKTFIAFPPCHLGQYLLAVQCTWACTVTSVLYTRSSECLVSNKRELAFSFLSFFFSLSVMSYVAVGVVASSTGAVRLQQETRARALPSNGVTTAEGKLHAFFFGVLVRIRRESYSQVNNFRWYTFLTIILQFFLGDLEFNFEKYVPNLNLLLLIVLFVYDALTLHMKFPKQSINAQV